MKARDHIRAKGRGGGGENGPSTSSIQKPCTPGLERLCSRVMKADFSMRITRSSKPWICSKPLVFPYQHAAKCFSFLLLRSASASLKTTSLTSKIFMGTAWRRFSRTVFSKPGIKLVRTIWYSAVLGFCNRTHLLSSSGWRSQA